MKYRKLPVVVDVFKIGVDYIPNWFRSKVASNEIILHNEHGKIYCDIKTLEGIMRGDYGDYIVKGIDGEIYPCKPNIFDKIYERID